MEPTKYEKVKNFPDGSKGWESTMYEDGRFISFQTDIGTGITMLTVDEGSEKSMQLPISDNTILWLEWMLSEAKLCSRMFRGEVDEGGK